MRSVQYDARFENPFHQSIVGVKKNILVRGLTFNDNYTIQKESVVELEYTLKATEISNKANLKI